MPNELVYTGSVEFTDTGRIIFIGSMMKNAMNPVSTGEYIEWVGSDLRLKLGPKGYVLYLSIIQGEIQADFKLSTLLGGILKSGKGSDDLCSLLGDDADKCKEFFEYLGFHCWMASKISEAAVKHGVDIHKFQLSETNLGPVVRGEISDSFMEEFQKITSKKPNIVDGPRM